MNNQIFSPKITAVIESLRKLPTIGKKSSQRLALYLLDKSPETAITIANSLLDAAENIKKCKYCQSLTEKDVCDICSSQNRDESKLCIIESMLDLVAIEEAGFFKGKYFVLNGRISPLDGIGPNELKLDILEQIIINREISEIILAISPTVEGETTAHFISQMIAKDIKISRIGFGVPFGGELEYLDQQTLIHAFNARTNIK
ncbi:recombination mediator RecR [Francisella philomiragia]|uniref:recombination mediator RecR n=1 Tax=Francisella philomiragia TaxID=28110 RepID=UPI0001AF7D3C|nr:recombination mediator RecR [Francisella philomiragia]AJI74443.1 recombination protein RecR [Francisella philomiragia subsp. philomiragia ATCC 25015]EET21737.1 recombination protein recR [Francisella philomiragia subsp. philomiragia ATCC 25015]MBK2094792.1 recombination protein RecR [Francisella philomiragia]MBK2238165.1 recombination protein RecR [Francisella philomiragia]